MLPSLLYLHTHTLAAEFCCIYDSVTVYAPYIFSYCSYFCHWMILVYHFWHELKEFSVFLTNTQAIFIKT